MSAYSLFVSTVANAWPDNVSDPFLSVASDDYSEQLRYNVKAKRIHQISLAAAGTASIPLFTSQLLADWTVMYVRVEGACQIQTIGKDTDGVTTITGYFDAYGTSILPGFAVISTYNLTSVTVVASTASTVQVLYALSQEDS